MPDCSLTTHSSPHILLLTCAVTLTVFLAAASGEHTYGIEDIKVTRASLRSSYRSLTGEGVRVESDANRYVSVSSTRGKNVLNITLLSPDALCVSIFNSHYIIAKVRDFRSYQVKEQVYLVPAAWKKYILRGLGEKISLAWLKKVLKTPAYQRTKQDLEKLLHRSEIKMLRELALEMSRRGLNGRDSRAAMAVYVLATRLSSLLPADTSSNCKYDDRTKPSQHTPSINKGKQNKRKCYYVDIFTSSNKEDTLLCKTCPRGRSCQGVCGPRCECWNMMCGDCCYHRGCARQDYCCRHDGKGDDQMEVSFKCFNVFGFDCDSPSTC